MPIAATDNDILSDIAAYHDIIGDIARGRGVTLIELARQHHVDPATSFRWVQKGLPRGDGTRVRLQAVRRGKRWLTTPAAVEQFFASLPRSEPTPAAQPIRTPSKRESDSARAQKTLSEKYGI